MQIKTCVLALVVAAALGVALSGQPAQAGSVPMNQVVKAARGKSVEHTHYSYASYGYRKSGQRGNYTYSSSSSSGFPSNYGYFAIVAGAVLIVARWNGPS